MNTTAGSNYKKNLWLIALPVMLNMMVSQLQMLIDRVFLGQLNVSYMSALGNVLAPMWTSMAVIFALTTGATILISHAMGAGDNEKARSITAAMFKYNNILALALFVFWALFSRNVFSLMGVTGQVLDYCVEYTVYFVPVVIFTGISASSSALLQTNSYTKPILISGILRAALNVILDWLLIFGNLGFPELGLRGASIATTIAEFIGVALLIVMIVRSRRIPTRPSLAQIIASPFDPYKASVLMGIPAAAEELLWNLGNLAQIRLLNAIDSQAAGIFTIIFSVEILPTVLFVALGSATMTLTGKETGANEFLRARKIGLTALSWSWIVAAAGLIVFMLAPTQILRLFTSDLSVITSSVIFLILVGIDLFPRSANIIFGSGIRGYGDTRWMMCSQIFGTIFVTVLAATFIFVFRMGILGVFVAIILDEIVRCLINYARFRIGPKIARSASSGVIPAISTEGQVPENV